MIELHDPNKTFLFTLNQAKFRIKEMFNFCTNIKYAL